MQAIASRPGTCALCPQPIVSGELIRRDDERNAWVHARCADAARRPVTRVHRPRPGTSSRRGKR